MSSLATKSEKDYIAVKVNVTKDYLWVQLYDGREIRVPLDFYPRLKKATTKQRKNHQLIGLGTGIHWPDIDEDLSVAGIVTGRPSII